MSDCDDCEKFKDNMPCYDDYRFCEKSLAEHDKKIRADAIDEFRNRIMDINTTIAFERYLKGIYDLEELMIEGSREISEELKEKENENTN